MMQSKEIGRPDSRDQRMREMRQVQIWVPETRTKRFRGGPLPVTRSSAKQGRTRGSDLY